MKKNLLESAAETRRREAELEAPCTDAAPDPSGRRRPQDHLAPYLKEWSRKDSILDPIRDDPEVTQVLV